MMLAGGTTPRTPRVWRGSLL
ncbi:hypothetical protein FRAAL0012 [Frankia alni ACN14a]|uniref:Uncharacterized protein n=1 Tax=Frankia alni (strain DSM 45986 / CECT 9034 / ACN14a) TaxID=326424 RepID=Q0RUQ0_FRAAA|nr:hypothetical protein FRAAL0012 [Frankia alni ACN14a]